MLQEAALLLLPLPVCTCSKVSPRVASCGVARDPVHCKAAHRYLVEWGLVHRDDHGHWWVALIECLLRRI
jgi:hypothetical protein